ncbi:hypothetical protein [Pseudodesulfovibrio sp.]|uniref:hypothetical protein n=1 Tax=unclassified Pseudodesulfovibrio TaxID=2661612 RepID=UPI003B004175
MDLDYAKSAKKINGMCSVCITPEDLRKEVKEGGSDKYIYKPYEDFRFGLGTALKQSCESVGFYENKQDALKQKSSIIIVPRVATESKGGFWTWPPYDFTFTLDADVYDGAGELAQHIHSSGHSSAGLDEWKKGQGYAGSKAMEQVLKDLLEKLEYNKFMAGTQAPGKAE